MTKSAVPSFRPSHIFRRISMQPRTLPILSLLLMTAFAHLVSAASIGRRTENWPRYTDLYCSPPLNKLCDPTVHLPCCTSATNLAKCQGGVSKYEECDSDDGYECTSDAFTTWAKGISVGLQMGRGLKIPMYYLGAEAGSTQNVS